MDYTFADYQPLTVSPPMTDPWTGLQDWGKIDLMPGAAQGAAKLAGAPAQAPRPAAAGVGYSAATPTTAAPVYQGTSLAAKVAPDPVNSPPAASPLAATAAQKGPRPNTLTVAPTATNDNPTNQTLYIARQWTNMAEPAFFSASADAGVQVNDLAGQFGDTLRSGPVGGPVPVAGGSSTITTAQAGTVVLGADGSFFYKPAQNFTGTDTFQYVDTEVDQFTGQLGLTSNTATVTIYVVPQNATPFLPGATTASQVALDTGHFWPKFHDTADNEGRSLASGRGSSNGIEFNPHLPFGVQGSPVLGASSSGVPEVFVPDDNNVVALNGVTGTTIWTSPLTGGIHNAPVAFFSSTAPGVEFLAVGTAANLARGAGQPTGNFLAVNGDTGVGVGSFTAQELETFTGGSGLSTGVGPVASSPTLINILPNGGPGFNGLVFGTDASQGLGASNGRLYAIRPDGTVAWETLLAGTIHGSPLFVPPSLDGTNPHGFFYVGTSGNAWGGLPQQADTNAGRFYKIDALTGQVLAEMFMPNNVGDATVEGSALLLPGTGGDTGTGARIFFTDKGGDVFKVSQTVAAPPAGLESPTLTQIAHVNLGLVSPTSPALSVDGTKIYLGTSQGVEALSATDLTTVWNQTTKADGSPLGAVVGSPAVVLDTTLLGASQVIFATTGAPSGVFDIQDTATVHSFLWSLVNQHDSAGIGADFGLSSPAIGGPGPLNNAVVFIGSKQGGLFAID